MGATGVGCTSLACMTAAVAAEAAVKSDSDVTRPVVWVGTQATKLQLREKFSHALQAETQLGIEDHVSIEYAMKIVACRDQAHRAVGLW